VVSLRRSRAATTAAAIVFGATAVGGLFVAGANPPPIRLFTALANCVVAFVVAMEAYRRNAHIANR
jgi:hypothetical protein